MLGHTIKNEYTPNAWDDFGQHYGWFAERYHWTPAQVDELPAWTLNKFGPYAQIWDELSNGE